jgi:hypothetical protein
MLVFLLALGIASPGQHRLAMTDGNLCLQEQTHLPDQGACWLGHLVCTQVQTHLPDVHSSGFRPGSPCLEVRFDDQLRSAACYCGTLGQAHNGMHTAQRSLANI